MKCTFRAIWHFLTTPAAWTGMYRISGHIFEDMPPYREGDRLYENLRCVECGYVEKGWRQL